MKGFILLTSFQYEPRTLVRGFLKDVIPERNLGMRHNAASGSGISFED